MVGLLTQDALFRALGAEGEVLELTKEYMTIWYFGVVLLIVPIMANGALRAMGDAKTPMRVMMIGAIINAILDPLLIFGLGPFPALDLSGAAYATLVARFCGFVFVFYVLVKKTDLLQFKGLKWAELKCSARQIFSVGIPASITNALGPVAIALITAVVARHGESGLAAYGIGSRVDSLVMMIPFALGGALSPFIGQNWGAHLTVRVSDGIRRSIRFGLLWGLGGCLVMIIFGTYIARVFTDDPSVRADVTCTCRRSPSVMRSSLSPQSPHHRLMRWTARPVQHGSHCCAASCSQCLPHSLVVIFLVLKGSLSALFLRRSHLRFWAYAG